MDIKKITLALSVVFFALGFGYMMHSDSQAKECVCDTKAVNIDKAIQSGGLTVQK